MLETLSVNTLCYGAIQRKYRNAVVCFIRERPLTIEDLEVITGLKADIVVRAVDELERLFLVPKPTIVKGVPRFDVNVNTRALVLDNMSNTDLYEKIQGNI